MPTKATSPAERWVEAWMKAGPELERIRFEKARRLKTREAILLLRDAFESALLKSPAKPISGLVEQQALFQIKFGLAVTGVVHPAKPVRNSGARAGDLLVLSKPLGTGAISTAGKAGKAPPDVLKRAVAVMSTLNRDASEAMVRLGAHAATDITGFGLLGHGRELAEAFGVTLSIDAARVPLLPGARELARKKLLSGGAARNRSFLAERVEVDPRVPADLASLFFDSETSGGLLIALPEEAAKPLVDELHLKGHAETAVIGRVAPRRSRWIEVGAGA